MRFTGRERAKKVRIDNIIFDSKLEGGRYLQLKLLLASNQIADLQTHVVFDFIVNGYKIGHYTIDFTYYDLIAKRKVGEEAKGKVHRDFPLRRNLFIVLFPEYEFRLFTGKKKNPRMVLPKKVII